MGNARQLAVLVLAFVTAGTAFAVVGEPLPAEAWQRKAVGFSIGIYYLKSPKGDPVNAARALAKDRRFAVKLVDKLDKTAQQEAQLNLTHSRNALKEYAPPSLESLRYFGRGLSLEQGQSLQKTNQALILSFAHPASQGIGALRRAEEMVLDLARRDDAVIWDDETREAFTPDAWQRRRLQSWDNGIPDVSKQIVIHAYNNDGSTRAITLGMQRFGLPDLVINDSVWSLNNALGSAINALAQLLVEKGPPDGKGVVTLKIADIRHAAVRKTLSEGILSGGKGEGRLRLLEAKSEAGDPENALAALNFDLYPGKDVTERQIKFAMAVFGAQPEKVVYTRDNADLLAASARARTQLPALQKTFQRGLAPGEHLLVKAPFATSEGGTEWMWVEVTEWTGNQIKGMLSSQPRHIPGLKAGQMVEVRQSELFDYLRVYPDGRREGNETSKLLK